jgi:hypothetical protein
MGELVVLAAAREQRVRPPATATKADVAAALNVSERTVTRYMDRGMPFERAYEHGAVRFDVADCKLWRRRHRP